ncbi:hypothetical protein CALCODRAFT_505199 [Calocera cornea HHB12733]|uniref:Proteophosphoglycan ppg4 n=1 Tax=Calocera cornea HHB12733 TaxID=1353952 RepID=A0A165K6B0_9BASI|nr:hypothetical protein CALCODRAFT_505199 [Calocera cornea HHB12733]
MTTLLLLTLLLTLLSLLSSSSILLTTLLPLLRRSAFHPSSPSKTGPQLTPFRTACVFLSLADVLALGLWLWQNVLDVQLGTALPAFELSTGGVGRLWVVLTARPGMLLPAVLLTLLAARWGRESTFGRYAFLLWAPALLLGGGTTVLLTLLAPHLTSTSFLSALLGYTTAITLLSTSLFLAYLLTPHTPSHTATWPANDDGRTILRSATNSPVLLAPARPSWAPSAISPDEQAQVQVRTLGELRRSESWLTSEAGSDRSRERESVSSWSFSSDEEMGVDRDQEKETRTMATTPSLRSAKIAPSLGSGFVPSPRVQHRGSSPDLMEKALLYDASAERQTSGSKILQFAAWTLYVLLPFTFTTPYLIHGLTNSPVSFSDQLLLSLSVTISSPLLASILLCSYFTPSTPQTPSGSSTDDLREVVPERPAPPSIYATSEKVWRSSHQTLSAPQPLERTLNYLRPSPKLSLTSHQLPEPISAEQDADISAHDRSVGALEGPAMLRMSCAGAGWSERARVEGRGLGLGLGLGRSAPPALVAARTSVDIAEQAESLHEESFDAQILQVERCSSSAAVILAVAPPTPNSAVAERDESQTPPRPLSESPQSDPRSPEHESTGAPTPPETPFRSISLRSLPPITPKPCKIRYSTRPRSISLSAATSRTQRRTNDDASVFLTPITPKSIRNLPMRVMYAPRKERSTSSAGSFKTAVTRPSPTSAGSQSMASNGSSIQSQGSAAIRRVRNTPLDRQTTEAESPAVGSNTSPDSEGVQVHSSLANAVDAGNTLDRAEQDAEMHQAENPEGESPDAVAEAQYGSFELPLETVDATPRNSFIVITGQTPVVEARPAPTQFTPGRPKVRAFHLPRRPPIPSAAKTSTPTPRKSDASAIPRPRMRAPPAYVVSSMATPSNTPTEKPVHPLRLLPLRQVLYKDGAVVQPREPLAAVVGTKVKLNDSIENRHPENTPNGPTFNSVEHASTPISPKDKAKRRMLKLVDSATSFASNRSKSTTLESIGPLRI